MPQTDRHLVYSIPALLLRKAREKRGVDIDQHELIGWRVWSRVMLEVDQSWPRPTLIVPSGILIRPTIRPQCYRQTGQTTVRTGQPLLVTSPKNHSRLSAYAVLLLGGGSSWVPI